MRVELSIKATNLPTWKAWEGIRELMQNAQDAVTEFGATLDVRYRKDTSTLVIENEGCTLPHEALLIGHSTKSERSDTIGKFGEGLKIGVLALIRMGHMVKIRSGSEVWTPVIERSDKFNADVLVFNIDKNREPKERVQVEVGGIDQETWDLLKARFLFVTKPSPQEMVKTLHGSLLLGEKFEGRVFVKGIFVRKYANLSYGYDLSDAELDRDRKMVERYDLQHRTQIIWKEAMATRPDLMVNFGKLLDAEAADVQGIDTYNAKYLTDEVKGAIVATFVERHGTEALPVASLADSQVVGHLGKKGIVCTPALRAVLEASLGDIDANKVKLSKETVRNYGWHELEAAEKANLERAIALVSRVTPVSLDQIEVVDFRDPKIRGMFSPLDGKIEVAKWVVANRSMVLRNLVHEVSHREGTDGEKDHVARIETIWAAIVEILCEETN